MAIPEIWKDVVGFEGLYIVNCHGEIRSVDHYVKCNTGTRLVRGKTLKPCDRGNGYPFVTMGKDGKQYNMSIHRVIAIAFLPNPDRLPEVNHKDTDPSNYDLSNLEWCDRTYNNNYANRAYKVAQMKKKEIEQIKNGVVVKVWNSLSAIGRECGISTGNISECCNGRRNTAGGYMWKFKEAL
jgi:hypothetical protein